MHGKDFIYYIIGLIVLYAFGSVVYNRITGNDPESVARRERETAELSLQQEAFRKEEARRSFALRESPVLWKTITELKTKIAEQNCRLQRLKKTFDDLGMCAGGDADYQLLLKDRDNMVKRLMEVESELDRAFLASVKYDATRGKQERAEFDRSASVDGFSEASGARQKFEKLRIEK